MGLLFDTGDPQTRQCSGCRETKPLSEFSPNARRCKRCNYDSKVRQRYGITAEEREAILAAGRCDICGTSDPGGHKNSFHLDHCHDSGRIRGTLCNCCNLGIGYLKHDISTLRAAITYLETAISDERRFRDA